MTWLLLAVYYSALAAFIVPRIRVARNRQRMLTWPQAKATLDEKVQLQQPGARPQVQSQSEGPSPEVHLREPYTYYARGHKYESQQLEPGFARQHRHYRNMARFYLMRQGAVAYFNPLQPEEAYLQPGASPLGWGLIGWGVGVLGALPLVVIGLFF
jgi:hypothetical protein